MTSKSLLYDQKLKLKKLSGRQRHGVFLNGHAKCNASQDHLKKFVAVVVRAMMRSQGYEVRHENYQIQDLRFV